MSVQETAFVNIAFVHTFQYAHAIILVQIFGFFDSLILQHLFSTFLWFLKLLDYLGFVNHIKLVGSVFFVYYTITSFANILSTQILLVSRFHFQLIDPFLLVIILHSILSFDENGFVYFVFIEKVGIGFSVLWFFHIHSLIII